MRHRIIPLLLTASLLPAMSNAGGGPRIWGQSHTHQIEFANDLGIAEGNVVLRISSPTSESDDQVLLSVPFREKCVATNKEIRCAKDGKTVLSGVVYRLTPDGSPRCFGASYEWRYTCVKGCRKELPHYLWIDPYEC